MPIAVAVALFGALGALARYGVDGFVERHTESVFPLATLAVNASGCLLAGLAVGLAVDRLHAPTWLSVGLVAGFLGAYTTFSAFAYELHDLLVEGRLGVALANALVSIAAGILAVTAGLAVARAV